MTRYRKSWSQIIEEVILNEALKPIDKSVIDAFYYKKEKEGKIVSTDGDTLTKMGIGGQQIAKWVGRKIKITAVSDVKSTEAILKYIKKSIPSGLLEEVDLEEIELSKEDAGSFCAAASKAKEAGKKTFKMGGKEYPVTIKVKIPEETEIDESAGLQLKMAFDDAKIKIKGVKSGKLVIAKKDKKKAEKVISKQMKNPADAKRVLGSQIVFEDVELDEKEAAYPATVDTLRKIVKDKQNQVVMFKSGQARVDLFTASAMVQVYDALKKPDMKKTFEKMITDKAGFMKTQAFAMKMIGK